MNVVVGRRWALIEDRMTSRGKDDDVLSIPILNVLVIPDLRPNEVDRRKMMPGKVPSPVRQELLIDVMRAALPRNCC